MSKEDRWFVGRVQFYFIHTRFLKLVDGSRPNEIEVNISNCSRESKCEKLSFKALDSAVDSADGALLTVEVLLLRNRPILARSLLCRTNLLLFACSSSMIVRRRDVGMETV